jgi:hypothetical protein
MKVESRTLGEQPFGFDIRWPFPTEDRKLLESALAAVTVPNIAQIGELETQLNKHLTGQGYLWDKTHKEECRVWRPDFQHSVDFIHPAKRVAIEVEKTEVKRIVHDVLKLMNASLTFVPRVRFGVLIYPKMYRRSSGKESPFGTIVRGAVPFYFKALLAHSRLNDILFLEYDFL